MLAPIYKTILSALSKRKAFPLAKRFLLLWSKVFRSETALKDLEQLANVLRDTELALYAAESQYHISSNNIRAAHNAAIYALNNYDLEKAAEYFKVAEKDETANYHIVKRSVIDSAQASSNLAYIGTVENAILETDYWTVVDGCRAYINETSDRSVANSRYVKGKVTPDQNSLIYTLPNPKILDEDSYLLVGGDGNYSNWVARYLMRLSLVEEDPKLNQLPILINKPPTAYQLEYLDLLGIGRSRIRSLEPQNVYLCHKLVIPVNLRNHPKMKEGISWLRSKLLPQVKEVSTIGKKIYITRKDTNIRKLVNEEALERALNNIGFTSVTLTGLSVREQISIFANASHIVSPHGAGLTNLIYCPKGTRVIEIVSGNAQHMDLFKNICDTIELRHSTIVSNEHIGDNTKQHCNFRVNVQQVLEKL